MEIPSLPTDNLYKFLAIFGLVLIVFSSYMLNQLPEKLYEKIEILKVKEKLQDINLKNDSLKVENYLINKNLTHKRDSLEFSAQIKVLQREVDKFPKLLFLFISLFVLGSIATIFGFLEWYYKTQKFNDRILENESKKALDDKMIIVHKIQFEKEFEVYNELWPKLIKLSNATQILRPMFESYSKFQSEEERRNNKIKEFNDNFNDCITIFEHNKPFYPEDIYNEIASILKISRREAVEYVHRQTNESNYWENAEKNMDEIIKKIDEVCLKIRDRIGTLKVKN